jgi:papain like cysteine protease AvrRpt2
MKRAILCFVLLNFVLTLACTRVHVEIQQFGDEGKSKIIDMGEIEEMDPKGAKAGLTTGELTCPGFNNETPAIAQEWGVWCWAASAQAIMAFHEVNVEQCGIVNKARAGNVMDENNKPHCCNPTRVFDAQCQQNGYPSQAFEVFGIDYRVYEQAFTQRQIAGELCKNGPFSYLIDFEQGGGHTFVVKDYRMDNEEMLLLVDQHDYYTDETGKRIPAGFKERPYDDYANAMYEGMPNTFADNYFKFKPPVQ